LKTQSQQYSVWQYRFWLINLKKAISLIGGSFWFIPSMMIILAISTSFLLPLVQLPSPVEDMLASLFADMQSETPAKVIDLIASSVITITSIAFSMTVVALVMASNQFGPRLIKNFMQNTMTQLVLGVFTATFIFCVLIVSRINVGDASSFYPQLSLLISLVLAIINVLVLIFFIHHVASSIRADAVVQQISSSLMEDMHTLQSENDRVYKFTSIIEVNTYQHSLDVLSQCDGYIQAIEYKQILDIATQFKGVLVMQLCAGQYVVPGTPIAKLYSEQSVPKDISLDGALIIGQERTALQDPLFAINQLVEMALRALSPSLNDPFTATNCIDRLASAMASFTEDNIPKTSIVDEQNEIRILTAEATFADLFKGAFNQIRQNSAAHSFVVIHLLDTFIILLKACDRKAHMCDAVGVQVQSLKRYHQQTNTFRNEEDQHQFDTRIEELEDLLKVN